MKIFKILSVGLIAFLGILEGKAAEELANTEPTVAKKLADHIETTRAYIKDIKRCEAARQGAKGNNNVDILLSGYLELQPSETGFTPNFNAADTCNDVWKSNDIMANIMRLTTELEQINVKLEKTYKAFALPTVKEIAPYIPGSTSTTGTRLKEIRVLTLTDVVKFLKECESFRQAGLSLSQGGFDNAIAGLNDSFCFYTMNGHLKNLMGPIESIKQSPPLAENDVAKIFYESNPKKDINQDFKEGLFELIKVIDENQKSAFLEFFEPNKRQEFLDIGKTIKDYVEEHKA